MKRFFRMRNIITLLSLFFLQSLLAQDGPPTPFDDSKTILPIDQYDILLVISLIGVAIWFYRKYAISKRYI